MKKYLNFLFESFPFLVVKLSVYMNRRVFEMNEVSHAYAGLYFKFVP